MDGRLLENLKDGQKRFVCENMVELNMLRKFEQWIGFAFFPSDAVYNIKHFFFLLNRTINVRLVFYFLQVNEDQDGWQTVGKPPRRTQKVCVCVFINMSNIKAYAAFSVFCIVIN